MADGPDPMPVTAQTRFQQLLQQTFAVSSDTALQLWTKLDAFLRDKRQLLGLPLACTTPAELNEGYSQVEYRILPYVSSLAVPVLGGLAAMTVGIVLEFGALLTAIVTILVFLVLLLRKGGSLDVIQGWISDKLAGLRL